MRVLMLSVLCVLLCCSCGPVSVWAQQTTRASLSQRISQWMVGRMGLGGMPGLPGIPGLPGVGLAGFGMPSITGLSGLGGFFGLSPISSSLLSFMGLGTRSQPTYVQAPAPPPPSPPPPPATHGPPPPPSPLPPSLSSHEIPPRPRGPHPFYNQAAPYGLYSAPVYSPPPSAYPGHGSPSPYRGHAPIGHGLPPPIYDGPRANVHRVPATTGEFYRGRGARGGSSYLFAEDASFGRPQTSAAAIPIIVPRHVVRGPIRGPVALKTAHGLMLGPFHKPVHQHGLPTISDAPVVMDDVASVTERGLGMHDLIDSSAMSGLTTLSSMDQVSMKDVMATGQANEEAMLGLDDALPFTVDTGEMDIFDKSGLSLGNLGGDSLFNDEMKVSELNGELNSPAVMEDDAKSLDLKENLLAAASERHDHRQPIHGNPLEMSAIQQQQQQQRQRQQQQQQHHYYRRVSRSMSKPSLQANNFLKMPSHSSSSSLQSALNKKLAQLF
ncbi:formin-like protein 14 [Varroa jacobsoni]|uniref:formin-like protein 14 n=1 Tax=Varroa jacobsoni TaxID=62625 RepID=UPI000BF95BE1|nr:formin-like protein 14 [Varroa jacobsoni]